MAWRKYKSYGKSALGIEFKVDGLEEYLKKIQDAGQNVDEAVANAVERAAPEIASAIKEGAERHRKTGDVADAVTHGRVVRDGNYTFVMVGVDTKNHSEAKEGVFQEYGDGHSPCFPDPFIRPAFDNYRASAKLKKYMQEEMKKRGVNLA